MPMLCDHRFPGTDRYRPEALIGAGATGAVFRVSDIETGATIALKTFREPAPEAIYRLKHEFRALAGIVHPNLVQLYDLVIADDLCFFTMEYVDGCDFVTFVRAADAGGRRLDCFLHVAAQLVDGLAALHAAGRLHRDVKPHNVLVSARGAVKLLDFDLTLVAGNPDGPSGEIAGTFAYMAPEQAWGEMLTPAADVYAAGVLFHEALAGALPFDGSPGELLAAKSTRPPPRLAESVEGVPDWLDTLVAGMLARVADQRPSLAALLAGFGGAAAAHRPGAVAPWVRRREVPFCGRERELSHLRGVYEEFRRRGATVVHATGISGIGKTELLRAFVDDVARRDGALVLTGRCHFQESVPFKALDGVVDALSRHLLESGDGSLAELRPLDAVALLRLFPVLGCVMPGSPPQRVGRGDAVAQRQRGTRALRDLLTRIAARRPLVVWIDDLQWSDHDSALILRDLLAPPDPPEILLILSYRAEDRAEMRLLSLLDAQALQAPFGGPQVQGIEVPPLDDAAARQLARDLCVRSGTTRCDVDWIVAEAGGSPFLIAEWARVPSGASALADGAVSRNVVRDRLEGLPESVRRLAELAAIAGGPIERGLLLQAAGHGEAGRPLVAHLEAECVVRATPAPGGSVVQTYHDKIREAVVLQLSVAARRERHLALAAALEARGSLVEPERVAYHFHGAGVLTKAADYAVAAADRAAAALAFERAAELYRSARQWDSRDAAWRRVLQVREGEALANAARFVDAALLYRDAARTAPRREALDLRRRVAEHFMAAGHMDEGRAALVSVLGELGLAYPRTPTRAAAPLAGGLLKVGVRGYRSRRAAAPPNELDRLRIDACHSAARMLVNTDAIRGMYFSLQALQRAHRGGDPLRLGLALGFAGGSLAATGQRWFRRWGEGMLDYAQSLARATESRLLEGTVVVRRGELHMLVGDWEAARRECDAGARLLEDVPGAAFERLTAATLALRAIQELGDLGELERRSLLAMQNAAEFGDRHSELAAAQHLAFVGTARDDLDGAAQALERCRALCVAEGFHLQHLYTARQEVLRDLYAGDAERAANRLIALWPKLQRARLLGIALVRVDMLSVRARVALARANARARSRTADLGSVERDAAALFRERRRDATVAAELLAAGVAAIRGRRAERNARLERAAEIALAAQMELHAAVATHARGAENASTARLALLGVSNPERWVAFYAPGV